MIHRDTLTLEQEFHVLEAAVQAGVRAPRPIAYLGEVAGRDAFAMERVEGETIHYAYPVAVLVADRP